MAQAPRPTRAGNGRYEVGDLLGRGGMAEVFNGRSLGSHGFEKRVAIKRILPELAGDHTFTSRLVVEAKLAVALQHANVVQVLDLVRDGHDVFLVMEFINGPTLRRLLHERYVSGAGPLSPGLSTYVLHEAAAGLDYAHSQPGGAVIHADISPSNLLLSRSGEVKIADFGIARREGTARAAEGKWGYMAPEQERGEPLTPRADLFALGVVLYELLTGVHPFNGRAPAGPRAGEPLVAPQTLRPDLPPRLGRLCVEMLDPSAAGRPASAKEVMERVAEIRYQQGWREGRSELAAAVAAAVPEQEGAPASPVRPATEHTNHPLTLVTRSLLAEQARAPHEAFTPSVSATPAPSASVVVSEGLMALPPADAELLAPSARPLDVVSLPRAASLPPGDSTAATLAFTVGGAAPAGWSPVTSEPRSRVGMFSSRTWIVLGFAALVGVFWGVRSASRAERQAEVTELTEVAATQAAPVATLEAPVPSARETSPAPVAPATPEATAEGAAATPEATAATPEGTAATPAGTAATPAGTAGTPEEIPGVASSPVESAASLEVPGAVPQVPAEPPPLELPQPQPAPEPSAPPKPRTGESAESGTLRIFSDPWAYATVGSQRLETPARVTLRPGRYVVKLHNPDLGLSRTHVVRVRSKAATTISNRWVE